MNGSLRIGIIGGGGWFGGAIAGSMLDAGITTPESRGTTAAAIEHMRAAGCDGAVAKGLEAAFRKSASIGGESLTAFKAGDPRPPA